MDAYLERRIHELLHVEGRAPACSICQTESVREAIERERILDDVPTPSLTAIPGGA